MAYGYFEDLPRRATLDKGLLYKAYNIANKSNFDDYQRGISSMTYKLFDKKCINFQNTGTQIVSEEVPENQQLAKEWHKPMIRKV